MGFDISHRYLMAEIYWLEGAERRTWAHMILDMKFMNMIFVLDFIFA